MIQLNHRQCRQARGLLKWNSQDLAGHTKLAAKKIEAFERGIAKLESYELRELHHAFTEAGLVFTANKVDFRKKPRESQRDLGPAPQAAPQPAAPAAAPTPPAAAPAATSTA